MSSSVSLCKTAALGMIFSSKEYLEKLKVLPH